MSPSIRRPAWLAMALGILLATSAVSGLGGAVPAAAATNLVSNPGFESGSLSGWTCSGTDSVVTSPVHSGSYALAGAANSADDAQCSQAIAVQPGATYTLSAW